MKITANGISVNYTLDGPAVGAGGDAQPLAGHGSLHVGSRR